MVQERPSDTARPPAEGRRLGGGAIASLSGVSSGTSWPASQIGLATRLRGPPDDLETDGVGGRGAETNSGMEGGG
jgi:hypothetical protein